MKKLLPVMLCLLLFLTACASAQTLTGKAMGYGGELVVKVTMEGDNITAVDVTENKETPEIGGNAIAQLPAKIVEMNTPDVDVVTGATVTSQAIIAAVKQAIDPNAAAPNEATQSPAETGGALGLGMSFSGRVGPGKDSQGKQIYSVNGVIASARFDKDGRITDLFIDQLEFASPNYSGEGMPSFTGYPGQTFEGNAVDDNQFLAEIAAWKTKRERGGGYLMTTGTWASQMDKYQQLFIGKTVAEIEKWYADYCSDVNGRPLKADSEDAKDKDKYEKLSEEDKAMLADVTSAATMSLSDAHGDIIAAIRSAYDRRVPAQ